MKEILETLIYCGMHCNGDCRSCWRLEPGCLDCAIFSAIGVLINTYQQVVSKCGRCCWYHNWHGFWLAIFGAKNDSRRGDLWCMVTAALLMLQLGFGFQR